MDKPAEDPIPDDPKTRQANCEQEVWEVLEKHRCRLTVAFMQGNIAGDPIIAPQVKVVALPPDLPRQDA